MKDTASAAAKSAGTKTLDVLDKERLAASRYLYTLGQLLFGSEPTEDRLALLDADLFAQALETAGLELPEDLATALADAQEVPDNLYGDYLRLFVGPAEPLAHPWESTYRSRSSALFRPETLDVRNAYRTHGFLPAAYPRVADDHIALELGFLAMLADQSQEALLCGNEAEVREALTASAAFLREHVLLWIDEFAARVAEARPESPYGELSALLAQFAHKDAEWLQSLSSLQNGPTAKAC